MDESRYTLFTSLDKMDWDDRELVQRAEAALPMSYAPYSTFHVAAALRLDSGKVITGVNQENASSPAGLCAEQVALYRKGISTPDERIISIAIVARRNEGGLVQVSPCGNCRQVMAEFVHRQEGSFSVIMKWEGEGWLKVHRMEDLLPFSFTAKSR